MMEPGEHGNWDLGTEAARKGGCGFGPRVVACRVEVRRVALGVLCSVVTSLDGGMGCCGSFSPRCCRMGHSLVRIEGRLELSGGRFRRGLRRGLEEKL
jgi:hypothetical protein